MADNYLVEYLSLRCKFGAIVKPDPRAYAPRALRVKMSLYIYICLIARNVIMLIIYVFIYFKPI